jgi:membrane protease YdiL (CAAX protease family)
MDAQLNTRRIVIYLAFAFGISWAVALAFHLTGGTQNTVIRSDLAPFLMNYIFICGPALANVATRLITRQGRGDLWLRPNFRRGWPFYLAVWLLPLLAMIVGGLAFYLLFPQSFDPDVSRARTLLAGFPSVAQASAWKVMLFLTPYMMIVQGVLVGGVIAIVEEFGWRGYLLQRLIDRFRSANSAGVGAGWAESTAARKAALLVGVIWGVWHWPFYFIPGVGLDSGYFGAPFLAPLAYLVFACSLSILLSWAALRSGSVWPASIGHGTVLGTSMLAVSLLKGAHDPLLGPQAMGLISGLGFVALALVLYFNRGAFAARRETGSQSIQAAVVGNRS